MGTTEGHVRGRVLVVDDEATIADVVCRYLVRAGYEASSAADGHGALAAARALTAHTEMPARAIASAAMTIAADICIYTNHQVTIEEIVARVPPRTA